MNEHMPQPAGASEREELLRELALRLAIYPQDPLAENPQLFVGELPPDLAGKLPLPEDSQVLGTLIRNPHDATILLDSSMPPGGVLDFYKEHMRAAGWEEQPPFHLTSGGFVHSMPFPGEGVTFCRSPKGPSLQVAALAKGEKTDVRLTLDLTAQNCQHPRMQRARTMEKLIPPLYAPPEASQQGGGSGWSDNEAHTSAMLQLPAAMEIEQLAEHYYAQLAQAGWQRIEAGHVGAMAGSTWKFQDEGHENWRGVLFIMRINETLEYALYLHVRAESARGWPSRGWAASSTTLGTFKTFNVG